MTGFTNNLSNLPPSCSDAEIERVQGGGRKSAQDSRLKTIRAERDNWRELAWDLAVHFKDKCKCREDKACELCTILGRIDEAHWKEPTP